MKTKTKDCYVKSISFERRIIEELEEKGKMKNFSASVNDAVKQFFDIDESKDSIRKELALRLHRKEVERKQIDSEITQLQTMLYGKPVWEEKTNGIKADKQ